MRTTVGSVRHRRRAVRGAALAAVSGVLLAACSSGGGGAAETPPAATASQPQPPGVAYPTLPPRRSGGAGADQSCDPTASLRPQGALPQPGHMPAGSTMARIQARGRLVAGVDQTKYLFGYRNAFTGRIEGFDIDMLREVARAIFGDPDRIQFRVVTPAERVSAVRSGEVDIVASTMTITCERRRDVEFSSVYYQSGQRVLVNRGSPVKGPDDLDGRRVCAAKGSTSIDTISVVARPVPVAVDDWTDCLVLMQQGQVDAVSTDDALLLGLAAQDPNTVLVGRPFTTEPYGMAMSKSDPDFVRFVNGVLERMRGDGTWAAIYQRWLGRLGPTPAPPAAHYRD